MSGEAQLPPVNNLFLRRISPEEAAQRAAEIKANLESDGNASYQEGSIVPTDTAIAVKVGGKGKGKKRKPAGLVGYLPNDPRALLLSSFSANGSDAGASGDGPHGSGQSVQDIMRKRSREAEEYARRVQVLSRTREGIVAHSAAPRQERIMMAQFLASVLPKTSEIKTVRGQPPKGVIMSTPSHSPHENITEGKEKKEW